MTNSHPDRITTDNTTDNITDKFDLDRLLKKLKITRKWNWLWWGYDIGTHTSLPVDNLTNADFKEITKIIVNELLPQEALTNTDIKNITGDETNGIMLKINGVLRYQINSEKPSDKFDKNKSSAIEELKEDKEDYSAPFTYQIRLNFKEFQGSSDIIYKPRSEIFGEFEDELEGEIREWLTLENIVGDVAERPAGSSFDKLRTGTFDRLSTSRRSVKAIEVLFNSLEFNLSLFKPAFLSASFGFAPKVVEGMKLAYGAPTCSRQKVSKENSSHKMFTIEFWADAVRDRNYLPFFTQLSSISKVFRLIESRENT